MTERNNVAYKCVECGFIAEKDSGFANAVVPAPEVSQDSFSVEQAQVLPVVDEAPASERANEDYSIPPEPQLGFYHDIGDCPECGSHQWLRTTNVVAVVPPSETELPAEGTEESSCEDCDEDPKKGFDSAVPPSPEMSQDDLSVQYATSPPQVEPAVKKEVKCEECGTVIEVDDKEEDMPHCAVCGSTDWGNIPH